jgi:hypothetical protein
MYTPDVDQIVPDGQPAGAAETVERTPLAVVAPTPPPPVFAVAPVYAPPPPQAPPWAEQPMAAAVQAPSPARKGRGWIVFAAIAAVGLIASGTLGYLLYTTTGQRDAARHQLASTQATLTETQAQLAARKATDAYVAMYVTNSGKVTTEYENEVLCDSYFTCLTAAQAALNDMKQFQTARAGATVPSALASADSQTGDALSAAIAGDQELITGMQNNDKTKFDDGYNKFNAAMLSFFKATSLLSAAIS